MSTKLGEPQSDFQNCWSQKMQKAKEAFSAIHFCKWKTFCNKMMVLYIQLLDTYIVGSQGTVQLGGPIWACSEEVQLRLRLESLFYSPNVPLKSK